MPKTTERRLRVGTRGSRLAIAQTAIVAEALEAAAPQAVEVETVAISTAGDRVADRPYEAIGPKGVFARDIQQALHDDRIDLAVHSLKDLPALEPLGLVIAAVPERGEPRDVLVAHSATSFDDLPDGATVGTSSSRRTAMLRIRRPALVAVPLRGNVDTRLAKVQRGEIDAAILAGAGLARLGRSDAVTEWLDPERFPPPPGQGALAIEARTDRIMGDLAWVRDVEHAPSRAAVDAERVFMRILEGGCEVPLGAWARWSEGTLLCTGFVAAPSGDVHVFGEASGTDPEEVGAALAHDMLSRGADELIEGVRGP
jgi:hydroxymethylbilane synthase